MSISFHPYILVGNSWVFPAGHNPNDDPNLHNGGAAEVLEELGLSSASEMWDADPVDIDLFGNAVWLAIQGFDGKPSREIAPKQSQGSGGVHIIDCGRPEGYRTRHLDGLSRLVVKARALGATHIGWG